MLINPVPGALVYSHLVNQWLDDVKHRNGVPSPFHRTLAMSGSPRSHSQVTRPDEVGLERDWKPAECHDAETMDFLAADGWKAARTGRCVSDTVKTAFGWVPGTAHIQG